MGQTGSFNVHRHPGMDASLPPPAVEQRDGVVAKHLEHPPRARGLPLVHLFAHNFDDTWSSEVYTWHIEPYHAVLSLVGERGLKQRRRIKARRGFINCGGIKMDVSATRARR